MRVYGGVEKAPRFLRCYFGVESLKGMKRSNTRCIDKHGTNEVQATILSTFVWYQRSSLAVVCLSDVADTDSFGNSESFRR